MAIESQNKSQPTSLLEFRADRYLPVFYMFALALALASASSQGWLRPITGVVFDPAVRYAPARQFPESEILLIEIGPESVDASAYTALMRRLAVLRPRVVAFNFVPESISPESLAAAAAELPVIFSRRPQTDPITGEFKQAEFDSADTVSVLPPGDLGIHRRVVLERQIRGVSTKTFEGAVLDAIGATPDPIRERSIAVNFLDGGNRIPAVRIDRVLGDGIPRSMVAGRIVLVGHEQGVTDPGLQTPITGGGHATSLLRFQGQALDTLLQDGALYEFGFLAQLLLYIGIILIGLYVYQTRGIRHSMAATVGAVVLYAFCAWVVLIWFSVALPLLEMTATQVFVFFVVSVNKIIKGELLLHRALIEASSKTRNRIIPASFFATEDPWRYVANLLSQTLEARRMIFLEKVEGDHRAHEVHALNCSIDSIDERRRDYQRTPYSTAITLQAPYQLEKAYLRDDGSGEVQFLVCLSFAGEIIGFWAFGVMPEAIPDTGNFRGLVQDFADQVAEMLYHRQHWLKEQAASKMRLRQYFRLSLWTERVNAFRESQALLDRRMATLENVFGGVGTAALLYDLFGRVVLANRRMEELLKQAELPLYSMNSVELVSALTGKSPSAARQFLYYVVVERSVISLAAPKLDKDLRNYLVHLRPLERDVVDLGEHDLLDAQLFRLSGVLVEVQEVTMFRTLNELHENLVGHLDMHLRNDLESILLAIDLLPDAEDDGQRSLKQILVDKSASMVKSFEEIQDQLNFKLDLHEVERYPLNYTNLLERAIHDLEGEAKRRKVVIVSELPRLSPLVIASPDGLTEVFKAFFTLLIEDAVEDTEVRLVVQTTATSVIFEFSNVGFGIPIERLNDYLYGHIDTSIEEFRRVRSAVRRVDGWRGVVVAKSEIGQGITIDLTLRGFI